MAENYIDAENDYMLGMKYKDIATKYGVSINTVKSWKQRYEWGRTKKGVHTKAEKVCAQKENGAHRAEEQDESNTLDDRLTEKQRLFCLYYVKYRNKVKAYQKAYQCSYMNACGHASEVFKNVDVQRKINRIMDEVRQDVQIDIVDLIQQQIDICRADITDFTEIKDGMISVKGNIDGTLVKEIKDTPGGISIKLYDKQKAIDWLTENIKDVGEGQEGIVILNDIPRSEPGQTD